MFYKVGIQEYGEWSEVIYVGRSIHYSVNSTSHKRLCFVLHSSFYILRIIDGYCPSDPRRIAWKGHILAFILHAIIYWNVTNVQLESKKVEHWEDVTDPVCHQIEIGMLFSILLLAYDLCSLFRLSTKVIKTHILNDTFGIKNGRFLFAATTGCRWWFNTCKVYVDRCEDYKKF